MIIKNIRCGYDGGGFACGPVPGTCYVEVMALEENGSSVFALDSMFDCFEKVTVTSMPVFDIAMNMMSDDADFEAEAAKIEAVATEEYEIGEFDEEYDEADEDGDEDPESEEPDDGPEGDKENEEDDEKTGSGENDLDWNETGTEYDDSVYCLLIRFTRFIMNSYLRINDNTGEGKKELSDLTAKYRDAVLEDTEF